MAELSVLIVSKDSQIILIAVIILFSVLLFAFWLAMLIDAIRNKDRQNAVWILVIALFGFLGSFVYYFAVKRNRTERPNTD